MALDIVIRSYQILKYDLLGSWLHSCIWLLDIVALWQLKTLWSSFYHFHCVICEHPPHYFHLLAVCFHIYKQTHYQRLLNHHYWFHHKCEYNPKRNLRESILIITFQQRSFQWIDHKSKLSSTSSHVHHSGKFIASAIFTHANETRTTIVCLQRLLIPAIPNSKVHGANMGPIWGWQDPGGPHVGPHELYYLGCQPWNILSEPGQHHVCWWREIYRNLAKL